MRNGLQRGVLISCHVYIENSIPMKPQGNQQEEQREREQINESGGGNSRTPDPGPMRKK